MFIISVRKVYESLVIAVTGILFYNDFITILLHFGRSVQIFIYRILNFISV